MVHHSTFNIIRVDHTTFNVPREHHTIVSSSVTVSGSLSHTGALHL